MLEILINKEDDKKNIALLENGRLLEYYMDEDNSKRNEGNIYVGVVKNIIKGMQAAFIDIGTEKNGFIHLKDILDKIDEKNLENITDNNDKINITDVIKEGQRLLVQVKKDSNLQKGARVSTHINLPSKYIALMPNTDIITVSQKIEDKIEQERLIKLVKENLSPENGAIIRTSAAGKNQEIIEDIKNVEKRWKEIQSKYDNNKASKPKLIAKANGIFEKMIIDLPEKSVQKITTNSKEEYNNIMQFNKMNNYMSGTDIVLKENEDVFDIYDVKKEISKLENRKIWLKCGGFITIDKTEALTAIDVNTGKYTGNKSVEDTVFKVNKEATVEIAKQIRLRDIGGIIIIDYIDMKNEKNKEEIQNLLEEKLKRDRANIQVEGFTKRELMELTRKHICSHKE